MRRWRDQVRREIQGREDHLSPAGQIVSSVDAIRSRMGFRRPFSRRRGSRRRSRTAGASSVRDTGWRALGRGNPRASCRGIRRGQGRGRGTRRLAAAVVARRDTATTLADHLRRAARAHGSGRRRPARHQQQPADRAEGDPAKALSGGMEGHDREPARRGVPKAPRGTIIDRSLHKVKLSRSWRAFVISAKCGFTPDPETLPAFTSFGDIDPSIVHENGATEDCAVDQRRSFRWRNRAMNPSASSLTKASR